jgi:hypothetical protein
MTEAKLPRGSPEAIEMGAHFLFGNIFLLVNNLPICCFPQRLSGLFLQTKVKAIDLY